MKSNKKQKNTDSFVWSDNEVELLLNVVYEYKVSKIMNCIDWESCQSKYSDIFDAYQNQYPSEDEASTLGKEFSNSKDELTKNIVTSKIKHK